MNRARKHTGTLAPQSLQDQTQIVSRTAQQHVHTVTFSAFQRIASQPAMEQLLIGQPVNVFQIQQTTISRVGNPGLPLSA